MGSSDYDVNVGSSVVIDVLLCGDVDKGGSCA